MNTQLTTDIGEIQAFLDLLPNSKTTTSKKHQTYGHNKGGLKIENLKPEIWLQLGDIIAPYLPNKGHNPKYAAIYKGDCSKYGGDQSAGDLAFCSHLARRGFNGDEIDQLFRTSGLYREKWDEYRGDKTYGQKTIEKALEGVPQQEEAPPNNSPLKGPDKYKPNFVPNGMPAREFAGPEVEHGVKLFPLAAASLLVALGGHGKTSTIMALACRIAAGKTWNKEKLTQRKVAIFFVEETQEELDRKFSTITFDWSDVERESARKNLLLISLHGLDFRLTKTQFGIAQASESATDILKLLREFDFKEGLVILDHMQGFTSGDLNNSETSSTLVRVLNRIATETNSAVLLTAHIAKANINAKEVEQGFASGSLAIENGARQLAGLIRMSTDDAKRLGITEDQKHDYVKLAVPKNNYGAIGGGTWLKKEYVPAYHTVRFEPVELTEPLTQITPSETLRIQKELKRRISADPFMTRNKIDGLSGRDEPLRASKVKVREALNSAIDSGLIHEHEVTDQERTHNKLPKQVKKVLRLTPT